MASNGSATSDDNHAAVSDDCSADSSPTTETLSPLFTVAVLKRTTSSSDVTYTIEVTKNSTPQSTYDILRNYTDLSRLHEYLTSPDLSGKGGSHASLIIPPLPELLSRADSVPGVEFSVADAASSNDFLTNYVLQRACRCIERFLNQLLSHPVLGLNPVLHRFVQHSSTPFDSVTLSTAAAGSGGVSSVLSWFRRALTAPDSWQSDLDASLQSHRCWLARYVPVLHETRRAAEALFQAQTRLSSQLEHLSTALHIRPGHSCSAHDVCFRLNSRYSDVVNLYKRAVGLACVSECGPWGERLIMFGNYAVAEMETMRRRQDLLAEYGAASDAAQKSNVAANVKTMQIAKEALEKSAEEVKSEVRRLKRLRVEEMLKGIREMAEAQVQAHQIMKREMEQHVSDLENFPITISAE